MWWMMAADGPIPVGDAIYVIGGGLVYVGEQLAAYGPQLVAMADKVKDKIGGNSSNDGGYDPKYPNKKSLIERVKELPKQMHHFLSNKHSVYSNRFNEIISKYKLSLNGKWNQGLINHLGPHAKKYHEYMLERITEIDRIANGKIDIFLEEFDKLKDFIKQHPEMLRSEYWK